MNGNQVHPQRNPGWFATQFHAERDGSLVYMEYPVDNMGRPDKDHPALVVKIGKDTVERLAITLARNQPEETPRSLRVRAEVLEALEKLDEIRAAQSQEDARPRQADSC